MTSTELLLSLGMRPEDTGPALTAAQEQAEHEDATRLWWATPDEQGMP